MTDGRILLHVGYHKAGSSYLQAWFQSHPQCKLGYASLAEIQSVRDILRQALTQPLPRLFVLSNEELSGGLPSPEGYFDLLRQPLSKPAIQHHQARVCQWLAALYPGAQVLIVTRGIADSIRSTYSQMVRLGSGLRWPEYLETYRDCLLEWWHIDFLVSKYEEAFGAENVLVVPYELLAENPATFSHHLEQFVGLESHRPELGVINPSLTALSLRFYTGLSRHLVTPIASRLRPKWALKLRSLYAALLWSGALDRPLAGWSPKPRLEVSPGYLEAFRHRAGCLAQRPFHQAYLSRYLVDV